jgi:hypothetical protein
MGFSAALQPEESDDDVAGYTPFQYMLQFMLQPLLVESGSTAAGAFIPALRKMCTYIKFTADRAVSQGCNYLIDVALVVTPACRVAAWVACVDVQAGVFCCN